MVRLLKVGLVLALCAAMTGGGPAAADSGTDPPSPDTLPPVELEAALVGPSMSWEEAIRGRNRHLTDAEWEAAVEDTKRNSSMSHYYPDRPDDPAVHPPAWIRIHGETAPGRGK